jgi:ABC-type uncharacterized transport system ATPase subunit
VRRPYRTQRFGQDDHAGLVAGLLEPTEGEVTVAGDDLRLDRSRAALSFVPDSPLLYPDLTCVSTWNWSGWPTGSATGSTDASSTCWSCST